MPEYIIQYINQHGYYILFILVFVQELGVPSFPNEIFLYYFGYLCSNLIFSISLSLPLVIIADISGTSLLYFICFYSGKFMLELQQKLFNAKRKKDQKMIYRNYLLKNSTIVTVRCIPFIRGYLTVYAALLKFNFKKYLMLISLSAIVYNSLFLLLGFYTGSLFINNLTTLQSTHSVTQFIFNIIIFLLLLLVIKKIIVKNITPEN